MRVTPGYSARHQGRLDECRGTVVHRGVGDVHTGQRADHRLVLVDRLQRALAHFGLVRGVGGEELRFRDHMVDDTRHVVVVAARSHEADELGAGTLASASAARCG